MFCVCLKFPYQHQIKKIKPNLIPIFLKKVETLAKDNGCKKIVKRDSYFYFFDNPISAPFFTLRFLYSLSSSIKRASNDIHESSLIVEYISDEKQIEYLNELQSINLNFNNVLIGSKANEYFEKYISLSDTKITNLKLCTSFSFFEDKNEDENDLNEILLFLRKDQNYIQVLYDLILRYPIFEFDVSQMLKSEAKIYFETRCVLSFYSKNRFTSSFPKYFVDAFIIYVKLHIKIYQKLHNIKLITIYTDCKEDNIQVEKLKHILEDFKVVTIFKKKNEIERIPDDLLQSMYILILAGKFIFYNELEDFFFRTTGTKAFKDLMRIMYRKGIILHHDCISSYQNDAIEKIEQKLKDKKNSFNVFISKYIYLKYKNAEIACDFNLKNTFDLLKFQYDEAFNVDMFFNQKKYFMLLNQNENNIGLENIEILKKYENIIKFRNKGKTTEAFTLTKELNSYFHNQGRLSGEYRSCSLLGLLFLESNNVGEALTYFIYSLEIAKKTKNLEFICEALSYLSIVYFLQKDFQNCSLSLQELSNVISHFFMQEWKVFYLFIQARLFIELGEAKKASAIFKLAKDFSALYFGNLEQTCDIWYARSLIAEGKIEQGRKILKTYKNGEALLFLLESFLLFPEAEYEEVFELKKRHDKLSSQFTIFPFFEDIAWYKTYKQSTETRLFEAFYSYYMIMLSSKIKKIDVVQHLKRLEEIALNTLYSKDNTASTYLYLSYIAQCKVDGEVTGKALGFLSKACNIMQKNTSLMYETSMRDKFMKQNLWNAKLFKAATENKFI